MWKLVTWMGTVTGREWSGVKEKQLVIFFCAFTYCWLVSFEVDHLNCLIHYSLFQMEENDFPPLCLTSDVWASVLAVVTILCILCCMEGFLAWPLKQMDASHWHITNSKSVQNCGFQSHFIRVAQPQKRDKAVPRYPVSLFTLIVGGFMTHFQSSSLLYGLLVLRRSRCVFFLCPVNIITT